MGLGLGLTADLCAGTGSGIFTAGLGLAGLLTGTRTGRGRSSAALAFVAAAMAALLPARDPLAQPLLFESLAGAGGFLLLPGRLFGGKRIRRQESAAPAVIAPHLKEQLNRAAARTAGAL